MSSMFQDAKAFSQFSADISKWNTSKVTNWLSMFEGAEAFDNEFVSSKVIEKWKELNNPTTAMGMTY
eukprot:2871297-Prymnesium_polylepis.1